MSILLGSSGASVILGSSGGGVVVVTAAPSTSGDFTTAVIGTPDYLIVATSATGTDVSAGTFVIPSAATWLVRINDLAGATRTVTVSAGSVSGSNPRTVTAGSVECTIITPSPNALVTVS